jgi:WD40 repeat protein
MLAALNKSKTVQIFDPRQQGSVQTANAHESIKSPKLIWLGDTDNLMTMGQDGSNDKEVKFWDIRNFGQPIAHQMISGSAGLPFLHYDRELQLVYCAHKGDNSITCYGYTPQDKNHLSVGATYKDKNIVKAFNILPKTTVNC